MRQLRITLLRRVCLAAVRRGDVNAQREREDVVRDDAGSLRTAWGRRTATLAGCFLLLAGATATAHFDARGVVIPLEPVQHISVGGAFTCAAVGSGKVYCWGNNIYGQIGTGTGIASVDPLPISGLPGTPIDALSAGRGHSCALTQGDLWCWGLNQYGQLGDGTLTDSHEAVRVQGVNGAATRIAAGDYHTCAVIGGALKCWGNSFYGQLGTGNDQDSAVPVAVAAPGGSVSQISTGALHSCAIIAGAAWCWGENLAGQLGDGSPAVARYAPVAVANFGNAVSEISAALTHTCARTGSALYCWGDNGYGELGLGDTLPRLTPALVDNFPLATLGIAAGTRHTCARGTGGVYCWGNGSYAQTGHFGNSSLPQAVAGVGSTLELSTRNAHTCVRTADGRAACWGFNTSGQLGDGSADLRTSPVVVPGSYGAPVAVAAGINHTCAGTADGVHCWGYNADAQLGRGTQTTNESLPGPAQVIGQRPDSVAAGSEHSCAAVAGAVLCWGDNEYGQLGSGAGPARWKPTPVPSLGSGVSQIVAGHRHTCALRLGGVWCWGVNANGQLGNGTTQDSAEPVAVSGLASGVSWISAGYSHMCAVQNGAAKCWGLNTDGQLGIGTAEGLRSSPQAVSGMDAGVTRIGAGYVHTCAIQNGAAKCWGYDGYGALGNGVLNDHRYVPDAVVGMGSGVTDIVGGEDVSCAIRDNSVFCWGADYNGDLGNGGAKRSLRLVPTLVLGTAGVAGGGLAIGGTHACAGMLDGSLRCWGDDYVGALGIGRVVISTAPLPVVRQDRLFADGFD